MPSTFLDACHGRNTGRIPVWIMRQAGRYLPEYREVRAGVSFQELCRSPELIAKVVAQPVKRFALDAAIVFSDILTLLEPMGVKVTFSNGGPKLEPQVNTPAAIEKLKCVAPARELAFVLESIARIKETMPDIPLIGFAGSPFTLACYLIEGRTSRTFDRARQFLHANPTAADTMLDKLVTAVTDHLTSQIEAGADAVQIFESWGGVLSRDDFARWVVRPVREIFESLGNRVPRLLYVNNIAPYLDLVRDIDCEVVGVDHRVELGHVAAALPRHAVQGNLDPTVLFGSSRYVQKRTEQVLASMPDHRRFIFNLGHGILQHTPLESVEIVVSTVHDYRKD
jgi:uroporphyrinogen decarboxylase